MPEARQILLTSGRHVHHCYKRGGCRDRERGTVLSGGLESNRGVESKKENERCCANNGKTEMKLESCDMEEWSDGENARLIAQFEPVLAQSCGVGEILVRKLGTLWYSGRTVCVEQEPDVGVLDGHGGGA